MSTLSIKDRIESTNDNVIGWAGDRNLVFGSAPKQQFFKSVEESGEIFEAWRLRDKDKMKDAIGDTTVVNAIMLAQLSLDPSDYITPPRSLNERLEGCYIPSAVFELALSDTVVMLSAMRIPETQAALSRAIAKDQRDIIPQVIIRLNVELQTLAHMLGLDFTECYELAYNEIKDRKGKMVDGVFVKEADYE